MAYQVKAFAIKPDDLSLTQHLHAGKKEPVPSQVVL